MFIREGRAIIRTEINGRKVFYNPRAKFTRSLGVLVTATESEIKGRNLIVVDALAATGVRGIRYFLESERVEKLFLNDRSKAAFRLINENLRLNKIEKAHVTRLDANQFLASRFKEKEKFDFVDVDPYGSPSPFIDNSISAVKNNGLLAITATDLAPLCGVYPWASYRKYGSVSFKSEFHHESASRILIGSVVQACGRRERIPEILLTSRSEHYIRIYLRLKRGKRSFPAAKLGFIFQCRECSMTYNQSIKDGKFMGKCPVCRGPLLMAGPMWLGEIHSKEFVKQMKDKLNVVADLRDRRRIEKNLDIFFEETDFPPYHYDLSRASELLKVSTPSTARVLEELRKKGFKASRTHFNLKGVKTNASYEDFLEAVKSALNPKQIK